MGFFNGSVWIPTGHGANLIDYNPISHIGSNSGLIGTTIPVQSYTVGISRDGITWSLINTSPNVVQDIAVGYERAVCTSNTNYTTVITIS